MSKSHAAVVFTALGRSPDDTLAGYWLAEAAYPWLALEDAGWQVVSISTVPTKPVPGGWDRSDRVQRRFLEDPRIERTLARTRRADHYVPGDFGVVIYAGGRGAMTDLAGDPTLAEFTAQVAAAGGMVGACGYGAAGLLNVVLPDGESLLRDRTLTAVSPDEESILEPDPAKPSSLAGALAERGAQCRFGAPFRPHVIDDGPLVSGQNPASAPELARRVVSATGAPS